MSKKPDTAMTEAHSNSAIEEAPDFGLDIRDAKEAKLARAWFGPKEGQREAIFLLPVARSGNVIDLYPSDYPGITEKYVWGCMLCRAVKASDGLLFERGTAVAGAVKEPIFMFEPSSLREVLYKAAKEKRPLAIQATGKAQIESRRWGKVMAWQWKVLEFPKPLVTDFPSLIMPAKDMPLLEEHVAGAPKE